jgi:hypothetical protein
MGALSSSRLVIEAKDAGNKVVKDSAERSMAREGGRWGCAGQLGKGGVGGGRPPTALAAEAPGCHKSREDLGDERRSKWECCADKRIR